MTKSTKLEAIRQSQNAPYANFKKATKQYNTVWQNAARAPIFCKITKRVLDGKSKKFYRTHRLIGSHAYQIAASGAAAHVVQSIEADCNTLREDPELESARAPWMPNVSKGTKMMMEQFLCALAQEATLKGHAVREGCGSTKRLNAKHMRIAWDAVLENVFGNTALIPKKMFVAELQSKKVTKKKVKGGKSKEADGEDDDYVDDEEEKADE